MKVFVEGRPSACWIFKSLLRLSAYHESSEDSMQEKAHRSSRGEYQLTALGAA